MDDTGAATKGIGGTAVANPKRGHPHRSEAAATSKFGLSEPLNYGAAQRLPGPRSGTKVPGELPWKYLPITNSEASPVKISTEQLECYAKHMGKTGGALNLFSLIFNCFCGVHVLNDAHFLSGFS